MICYYFYFMLLIINFLLFKEYNQCDTDFAQYKHFTVYQSKAV